MNKTITQSMNSKIRLGGGGGQLQETDKHTIRKYSFIEKLVNTNTICPQPVYYWTCP
jgi:hypothetical protein